MILTYKSMALRACMAGVFLTSLLPYYNKVIAGNTNFVTIDTIDERAHRMKAVRIKAQSLSGKDERTSTIQTVSQKDFAKQGITSLDEAVKRMAGTMVKDYGGAGGMKTVSVRGLGAAHTAVSYDGIMMSNVQTGQIDLSRFNLNQLDGITLRVADDMELLGSARNFASSSNLNLISSTNRKKIEIEHGSFGRYGISGEYGGKLDGGYWLSGSASFLMAENDYPFTLKNGFTSSREHRTNSNMRTGRAEINLKHETDGKSLTEGKVYYYSNHHHLPGIVIYYNPQNDEKQNDQMLMAQGRWMRKWHTGWNLQLMGKLNWEEQKYEKKNEIYAGGRLAENYWQREGYASAAVSYDKGGILSGAYAADYSYNTLTSSGQTPQQGAGRHSLLQSASAMLRYGRLKVMARAIGSYFSEWVETGDKSPDRFRLSPSFNLSFRPLDDHELYLKAFYKDIFRLPTFAESYYYHLGNAHLVPERAKQTGVGIVWRKRINDFLPELKVSADGYTNNIKAKIVSVPINLHTWRTINMGTVKANGIDFTLHCQINPGKENAIYLDGNYSWQDVKDKTQKGSLTYDKQLAYIPEHSGSLNLAWENKWINISTNFLASADRYGTHEHSQGTLLKAYNEWGLTLWKDFSIQHDKLTMRFDLKNIFDKQYFIINGYPMPGRIFRISLTYNIIQH